MYLDAMRVLNDLLTNASDTVEVSGASNLAAAPVLNHLLTNVSDMAEVKDVPSRDV